MPSIADKFVMSNPGDGPMGVHAAGQAAAHDAAEGAVMASQAGDGRLEGNDEASVQQAVQEEVNRRMEKACNELVQKHAKGPVQETSEDGPSGSAYQAGIQANNARKAAERQQAASAEEQHVYELKQQVLEAQLDEEGGSDDDEEFFEGLDNDPALDALRQRRLAEMKKAHETKQANLARGHGRVRDITQDEFLPELTGESEKCLVHFYHKDFPRCKVMEHHFSILAPQHIEAKFVRIDAEKAPFFVEKLRIRTLPCVIYFMGGLAVDRITGFEGLCDGQETGAEDEWPTWKLAQRLAMIGAIEFTASATDEDMKKYATYGSLTSGLHGADAEDLEVAAEAIDLDIETA